MAVIEGDPKTPGKLVAFRLRMPDGYRIAPHWHFGDEHVTVLSGALNVGLGDTFDAARMETLPTGSFAILPARHHHYVAAQGETEIEIYAVGPWKLTYVHPEDDPSRNR
jgi:quercetin dioxygenase-like cupin family protein